MKNYNYNKESQKIYLDITNYKNKKIRDGKKDIKNKNAVLKKFKIKGGTEGDYIWDNLSQFFLTDCKFTGTKYREKMNFEFKKIYRPNTKIDLVIFGKEIININGNNYLPYIYYLYSDNIKFKKISFYDNKLKFENISYDQLKNKINGSNDSYIDLLYYKLAQGTAQYSKEKTEEQIKLKNIFIDQYEPQQPQQLQQPQQPLADKLINKTFNIKTQNLTNKYHYYRCEDPSLEVKINLDGNISFGYDEYLFVKAQDNSYKLYYKYSYRGQNFSELIKKEDGTFEEKQIDINLIPTYDILRLYNAIKENSKKFELKAKLIPRIETAKQNISKTGEAFLKLDHSNFEKEKRQIKNSSATENTKKITSAEYKNFGKVKKRRVTEKTYIFFGAKLSQNGKRNLSSNFMYVCFREDNNVFYYDRMDLNKKIPLYEFPYIYPLEDLISFILLRRMITNDNTFADIIYKEADDRIKFLKTNKFAEKMLKQEFPKNYDYHSNNTIKYSQNYKNKLLQQVSLLPRSQNPVSSI